MNQGEENRFDGLLRNKFENFEQPPSPAVWGALSEKIPSTAHKTGWRGIRPFVAGMMLGMATMFGAGSAYLHFSDQNQAAEANNTADSTQNAGTQFTESLRQSLTDNNTGTTSALTENNSSYKSTSAGSGTFLAYTASRTIRPEHTILIPVPEVRFISQPAIYSGQPRQSNSQTSTQSQNSNNNSGGQFNNDVTGVAPINNSGNNLSEAAPKSNNTASEKENSAVAGNPIADKNTEQTAIGAKSNNIAKNITIESAWLIGLELDTTISREFSNETALANNSGQLHNMLTAQATVLALLQNRNDSLQLILAETDEDSLAAKARIHRQPVAKPGGSIRPPAWPFPSRWAISLIVETTPGWGNIEHGNDLISNAKEISGSSLSQQIRLQHRINSRLSVSAGVGLTQLKSNLRYNRSQRTEPQTSVVNDTVFVNQEYWSIDQSLTPGYNFVTVPLALHQKFKGLGRMSLGFSVGTHINVFSGGNRPVWNGDRYQLEKISSSEGPYRQINAALHGSLDLGFRISPKMNLLVSPTLRWWALTPLKDTKSSYNLVPGLQVGAGWDL